MVKEVEWIVFGKLWLEYCKICHKETKHRYLNCEEHENKCDYIVCCECGESLEDNQ